MAKSRSHSIANTNPTPQSVSKHDYHNSAGSSSNVTSGEQKKSVPVQVSNVRPDNIESKAKYTLYQIVNGREHEYGDRDGATLREQIAYEKLVYNSKEKVYVSKKGIKYRIRKR